MIKNLRLLRDEKGLSQEKLGAIFDLSQQSIYKYETRGIEPDIDTLIKMADYFDVSVDYLIGNTDIRHKMESVEPHDLNDEEAELVENFRMLSRENRRLLLSTSAALKLKGSAT